MISKSYAGLQRTAFMDKIMNIAFKIHFYLFIIHIFLLFFFYKEDFIENQQKKTRLTKTMYTAIYKLYNPPQTSKYRHYT